MEHAYYSAVYWSKKKADVVKYMLVLHHVGLPYNQPPARGGLPFIQSSDLFLLQHGISSLSEVKGF